MKGFPAVLSQRTNTLLIISTAAVFSVVDLCSPAQAQGVNVRSEVFLMECWRAVSGTKLVSPQCPQCAHHARFSQDFGFKSKRPDLARTKLGTAPFLDFLVIKVRNDGWEDFHARELDPFAVPGQFAPGGDVGRWGPFSDVERVRNLVEKKSTPIGIKEPLVDWRCFFASYGTSLFGA